MNLITGYNGKENGVDRTGYMRADRPLVTNVEPLSQMWATKLTIRKSDGTEVDYDPKNPQQFTLIVKEVRDLLDNPKYNAQVLAASGVVIPYNARMATDDALYQEAAGIWADYYNRNAAGEWTYGGKWTFDAATNKAIKSEYATKKQAAYEHAAKTVAALYDKKAMLWSDDIPYGSWKMNRTNTNFREVVLWKDGPNKGEVAPPWAADFQRDKVDIKLYPAGDHKTNFLPWTTVDDVGKPSYDARAGAPWQNEFTNRELVESKAKGYIIPEGLGAGEDLLTVLTGGGATGSRPTKFGAWSNDNSGEYLFPARGYVNQFPKNEAPPQPKWNFDDITKPATLAPFANSSSGGSGGWGGGGGFSSFGSSSGGGFAAKIYSHPAYSLNTDKPAGMYSKNPIYTRFDYLRPKVFTKGSREAYRREDF